jgi:hypothetical protein
MATDDISTLLYSLQGSTGTQPVLPAAPTLPDLFSLISAASTGTSGGTRLQILLTDEHGSMELCRHGVGTVETSVHDTSGGNIETCGTSHHGDPVALEPKTFYILWQTSPSQQILLIPCLHASRLAAELIEELLQEQQDLSEWAQIFRTIQVTLTQTSGLVGHVSHKEHQRRSTRNGVPIVTHAWHFLHHTNLTNRTQISSQLGLTTLPYRQINQIS